MLQESPTQGILDGGECPKANSLNSSSQEKTDASHAVISAEDINDWNDKGYPVKCFGDTPSVVLLGETHYTTEQQQKQIDLILRLQPEYVLYEVLAGEMYDPRTRKFTRLVGRKFNYIDDELKDNVSSNVVDEMLVAANNIGFKIIGCDTTQAEEEDIERKIAQEHQEEYVYEETSFGGYLIKRSDPEWQLFRGDDLQMPFRDEFMANTIVEYKLKTRKPLVVIVGAQHAANISERGLIKNQDWGYYHIDQRVKRLIEK